MKGDKLTMLKHGLCLDTKGVPDTSGDGKEEWDTCLVTWNNTRVSQSNTNSINLYSNIKNQVILELNVQLIRAGID